MHAGLASLIEAEGAALEGRRILMYSYGSGLAASLWSLIGRRIDGKFALGSVAAKVTEFAEPLNLLEHYRSNGTPLSDR